MRNLAVRIRYLGTRYCGWQVQKNGPTIMQELNRALLHITGSDCEIKGCSRTDSGVHAQDYCFSFKTSSTIPPRNLVLALNCLLPDDIAAYEAREVPLDFHARYSVCSKEYRYRIYNSEARNPFLKDVTYRFPHPLDEKAMCRGAGYLIGKHDFKAFCSARTTVTDTVRTVMDCAVWRDGEEAILSIRADGFLYNMVRIIAGTLLEVGTGQREAEEIPQILASRDRNLAGITAPPHGLVLYRVFYSE